MAEKNKISKKKHVKNLPPGVYDCKLTAIRIKVFDENKMVMMLQLKPEVEDYYGGLMHVIPIKTLEEIKKEKS